MAWPGRGIHGTRLIIKSGKMILVEITEVLDALGENVGRKKLIEHPRTAIRKDALILKVEDTIVTDSKYEPVTSYSCITTAALLWTANFGTKHVLSQFTKKP